MPLAQRTSQARDDLLDILTYVGQRGGVPAATRLAREIDQVCQRLAQFPGVGRQRPDLGPNLMSFPVRKYIIVYRPIPGGIEIVRVIHGSRNLPSLFGP